MIFKYPCQDSTKCHPITIDLLPGRYRVECYGAEGGTGLQNGNISGSFGGKGAYASGILTIKQTTQFHLFLGGQGTDGYNGYDKPSPGGWNGGGDSGKDTGSSPSDPPDTSGGGGGATDIRLILPPEGEEFDNNESLSSRIIVAAGGSGSAYDTYGAPGGDITGYKALENNTQKFGPAEVNQTHGFALGKGENGKNHTGTPSSGAGAGYYGGTSGQADTPPYRSSSSGSSYVSGHKDCPKFQLPTDPNIYFEFSFPKIVNGSGVFPSLSSDVDHTTEIGHSGNGAIKITEIRTCSVCQYHPYNSYLIFLFSIMIKSNSY